jgi:hypothetical protein
LGAKDAGEEVEGDQRDEQAAEPFRVPKLGSPIHTFNSFQSGPIEGSAAV